MEVPALVCPKQSLEGADLKAPSVNIGAETTKMPHFKLPKFGLLGHGLKIPKVANADLDMSAGVKPLNMEVEGNADVEDSPKSKLWPFKWGRKSETGDSGKEDESDSEAVGEVDVPAFTFHRLPKRNIDDGNGPDNGPDNSLDMPKSQGIQEFVLSKGIRLPKLNSAQNVGEKVDIMERLKLARAKAVTVNTSPTEAEVGALSASASNDSSLTRGETFKVTAPDSGLGLDYPVVG